MHAVTADTVDLGAVLPLWSVAPFLGILLSIALFPLLAPRFWHRRYPAVAVAWAAVFAVPFVAVYGGAARNAIAHVYVTDYVPFLILIGGLFTVAGGIVVGGALRGTPATNTAILAIGSLLASCIGTTGASMVLIRPLLQANKARRHRAHTVVFFIFLVANIGGTLTPMGDPPLFLGFLRGVPFFWTFRLARELAVCLALLLPAYFLLDRRLWAREEPAARAAADRPAHERLVVSGVRNVWLLALIVGAVLLSGLWDGPSVTLFRVPVAIQNLVRDVLIVVAATVSLAVTPRALRRANEFSWGPIREVAWLFAGIFMTIIPALEILRAGEHGALGGLVRAVDTPARYFWATGLLSSVLDNAPTYLTFFTSALGRFAPGAPEAAAVQQLLSTHARYLEAISVGAVFMGANTYVGNAPNFMVRAIAEESGVLMPSFFGYTLRWAIPLLMPVFLIITLLFR